MNTGKSVKTCHAQRPTALKSSRETTFTSTARLTYPKNPQASGAVPKQEDFAVGKHISIEFVCG